MITAHLYSLEDVGVATAIVSSMSIIVLLSRLGFDQSIIRYFPLHEKGKVFTTIAIVTTILSLVLGIILLANIDSWSPDLSILREHTIIYLFFIAIHSLCTVIGMSYVALRKSGYYFIQSLIMGLRVVFLFPLAICGAIGVFIATGISTLITTIIFLYHLVKFELGPLAVDLSFLKSAFHYSLANYISSLLMTVSSQILPIMVLNILGAEEAAQYFIAYSVVSVLFMIPSAIGTSLFVEGCHGEAMLKGVVKSILAIFALLTPSALLFYFYGNYLLGLFGTSYLEGVQLLNIMALSSFLVAPFYVYLTIHRVRGTLRKLTFISLTVFISQIITSYILMNSFGLIGIGYAWVISYFIGIVIIIPLEMKQFSKFSKRHYPT